jgi:hypothetical protein
VSNPGHNHFEKLHLRHLTRKTKILRRRNVELVYFIGLVVQQTSKKNVITQIRYSLIFIHAPD